MLGSLIHRCRRGDSQAWADLVNRYQRLVYSVAARAGLTPEDREDVFQATFVALFHHLDRIERPETLPKWISVTAAREALRVRRFRQTDHLEDLGLDEVLAAEEPAADALAIASLESDAIWQSVHAMRSPCRDLLRLLYGDPPHRYEEVAATLGLPVGAIGPTRARCLEKLRELLKKSSIFTNG